MSKPTDSALRSVFVYGTLMPAERWEGVARQGGTLSAQAATLTGAALADLRPEGYPALFALGDLSEAEQRELTAREVSTTVQGYLYTYTPLSWPAALPFLDELEGLDLVPPLYRRRQMTVQTATGQRAAWAYFYARAERRGASGFSWVPSGSWKDVAQRWQEGERVAWEKDQVPGR